MNNSQHLFVLAHLDGFGVALNSLVNISTLEVLVSLIFKLDWVSHLVENVVTYEKLSKSVKKSSVLYNLSFSKLRVSILPDKAQMNNFLSSVNQCSNYRQLFHINPAITVTKNYFNTRHVFILTILANNCPSDLGPL